MAAIEFAPITSPYPWHEGRRGEGGATNLTRGEIARRCRDLLDSDEYRQSLMSRIKNGTLPAAMETMLWAYAYGKPVENIELTVHQEDMSSMSLEELQEKAEKLKQRLSDVKAIRDSIPAEIVQFPVGAKAK